MDTVDTGVEVGSSTAACVGLSRHGTVSLACFLGREVSHTAHHLSIHPLDCFFQKFCLCCAIIGVGGRLNKRMSDIIPVHKSCVFLPV